MPIVCLKHINQPIQSTPSSPLSDTISNRILFTFKILPIANKKLITDLCPSFLVMLLNAYIWIPSSFIGSGFVIKIGKFALPLYDMCNTLPFKVPFKIYNLINITKLQSRSHVLISHD